MRQFVDNLLSKMTVEEKLGQLNLVPASDEIVTGGTVDTQVGQRIASGQLGGIFNLKGVEKIRALQDIAVKKSRLGIPYAGYRADGSHFGAGGYGRRHQLVLLTDGRYLCRCTLGAHR